MDYFANTFCFFIFQDRKDSIPEEAEAQQNKIDATLAEVSEETNNQNSAKTTEETIISEKPNSDGEEEAT